MTAPQFPIVASSSSVAGRHTILGALVNLLGLLARLGRLIFWIAAMRLYGAERVGDFAVAFGLLELIRQFSSSGVADAVVLFLSRDIGREEQGVERMEAALSTAIWLVLLVGGLVIVVVFLGGGAWAARFTLRPVLVEWAPILVGAVPLLALAELFVAATRAHMIMKWHALVLGGLQPGLLLFFAGSFYLLGVVGNGLAWAWLMSALGTAIVAGVVFTRHFDKKILVRAIRRPRLHRPMLQFVLPQNLNMTFNYFATNLDLLLLGVFGLASDRIAFYAAGVQITKNLRSVKVAFGSSFGPVIARYHVDGRTSELSDLYGKLSSLALSGILPIVLSVAILRSEFFALFDPAFAVGNSFVFYLLALPVLSCAVGLSGNLIVMTGHVRWNLLNSVVGALANIGLNVWLIPLHGLWGAAIATLLAGLLVQGLQVYEAMSLLRVSTKASPRFRPLSAVVPSAVLALVLDSFLVGALPRLLFAFSAVALYGVLLFAFALEPAMKEDLRIRWRRWVNRKTVGHPRKAGQNRKKKENVKRTKNVGPGS